MKSYAKPILTAIISALLLSGCSLASHTPPVNENDLLRISSSEERVAVIRPNVDPGIFTSGDEPSEVVFSWDGDAVLRVTEDCSVPTVESDIASDGVVPLLYTSCGDGTTYSVTVRLALFEGEEMVSEVYTFVYMHAPFGRFDMPVVTLTASKKDLYDYNTGILVPGKLASGDNPIGWQAWYHAANYYMRGIEWERPVSVSVFGADGEHRFTQDGGIRASGGYTRYNTQKSLRIYSRRDYTPDSGVFTYAFWGALRGSHTGTPVSYSDTVLFRGGSNNEGSTIFTTPALLLLLEGTHIDAPAIQTVVEYLNGSYKGVLTQLEDFDEDYFEHHYDVPKEYLTTVKGSVGEVFEKGGWRIDDGPSEELDRFFDMLKFIVKSDMSEPDNYARACELLDIQNFIEYIAYEAFIFNTDWPQNNMRVWRYNGNDTEDGYAPEVEGAFDGRWRFLSKDLDLSFGFQNSAKSADPYEYMSEGCTLLVKNMYSSLMKNEEFADLYYSYMCTLAGEVLSYERCRDVFDLVQVYTGREVAYSAAKLGVAGGSRGNWNSSFDVMRSFARSRGPAVLRYTRSHTKRTVADVTVTVEGEGNASLGWYPIESGTSREYLRDTRVPLTFDRAVDEVSVTVEGGHIDEDGYLIVDEPYCTVHASFTPTSNVDENGTEQADVVLNEVKFRGDGIEWIELYNTTDEDVLLEGWSLGKSAKVNKAREFDTTVIEPHGYALICTTDYANSNGIEGLSVPLSLGNGDTLYLFDENGDIADSVLLETPSAQVHLGRYPDGGEVVRLAKGEATPAGANVMEEYGGSLSADLDTFEPYLLAWGRAYALSDYMYDRDGVVYCDRDALLELCEGYDRSATITLWLKKHKEDMPISELLSASSDMDGATLRYIPRLRSYIIG